jgi:hypothetical protein
MGKAQIEIGKRAYEEVLRIFDKMQDARYSLGTSNKNHLYEWMNGVAPSAKYLQRLHYLGADVIYILTGTRGKNENRNIKN